VIYPFRFRMRGPGGTQTQSFEVADPFAVGGRVLRFSLQAKAPGLRYGPGAWFANSNSRKISDEPLAQGLGNSFGLRADVQFPIDRAQMHVHCVLGNRQMAGDFFLDEALDQLAEHFLFAGG